MRDELRKLEGARKKFAATYVRLGKKTNYNGFSEETVLLKNVIDLETGDRVSDHLWFGYTKGFQAVSLKEGSVVEFEARIKKYKKGYVSRQLKINRKETDFKLSHPTRIRLIKS